MKAVKKFIGHRFAFNFSSLACIVAVFQFTCNVFPATNAKNPEASTALMVRRELKQTDAFALTKRIELLESLCDLGLAENDPCYKERDEAVELYNQIERSLAFEASDRKQIERQIAASSRFAPYLQGDSMLLTKYRYSSFRHSIQAALRKQSETGDFDGAIELQNSLAEAGLNSPIEDLCEEAIRDGLSRLLAQRIQPSSTLSTEEDYIISRLFDQHQKYALAISIIGTAEPSLVETLKKSLLLRLGHRFDLAFLNPIKSADKTGQSAALRAQINIADLDIRSEVSEIPISSRIPGTTTETVNPDFRTALEDFENSERDFRESMREYYENEHRYHLERVEEVRQGVKDGDFKVLPEGQMNANSLGLSDDARSEGYDANGNPILSTSEIIAQDQEIDNMIRMTNLDEIPEAPKRPHEERWKIVVNTPPTVIERSEDTPYEYTSRKIHAIFEASSQITITRPVFETTLAQESVSKKHDRIWFQNLAVHPRDNSVGGGDYSQEKFASEKNLFFLEYTARCATTLLGVIEKATSSLANSEDPRAVVIALSARLATMNQQQTRLSMEELRELAEILNSPASSKSSIRAKCLELTMRKSKFDNKLSHRQFEALLSKESSI